MSETQTAERVCAIPGCFGRSRPCRASCCSGSRWYCVAHAHRAQEFLDSKDAPNGHFGARHAEVLNLVESALEQKPPERTPVRTASPGPLHVGRLFAGLGKFGTAYSVLRVFADDLSDSADVDLAQIASEGDYHVAVYASGVVHIARPGVTFAKAPMSSLATAVKASLDFKTAYWRSRVLGLLIAPSGDRVFSMEFDGDSWRAYDGSLLRTMKKHLLEPRIEIHP